MTNNIQQILDMADQDLKVKRGKEYNLGQLIDDLEKLDQDKEVIIEDNVYPSSFMSWRGIYAELGLDFSEEPITVKELLKRAKEANGSTYCGYKGPYFTMDLSTPIHIAEYGRSTYKEINHKVIGIEPVDNRYVLITRNDGWFGEE